MEKIGVKRVYGLGLPLFHKTKQTTTTKTRGNKKILEDLEIKFTCIIS